MNREEVVIDLDDDTSLRLVSEADAQAIFDVVTSDREHLRNHLDWVDQTESPEFTRNFIRSCQEAWERGDGIQLAIWHEGTVAGGLGTVHMDHRSDSVEIGYWLRSDLEGRGLMCRCCRALIEHLVSERGFHRVVIRTGMENLKSRAVAERLGFTLEGTLRESYKLRDEYIDTAVYSLLSNEWDPEGLCGEG